MRDDDHGADDGRQEGGHDDPLDRLERNELSTRQAVRYLVVSMLAVGLVALVVALFADVTGQRCPEGPQLCTTTGRVELVVVPTLLSLVLAVVCLWETYRRWRDHVRWRPWLFVSQLMWLATTGYLLVSASVVFSTR